MRPPGETVVLDDFYVIPRGYTPSWKVKTPETPYPPGYYVDQAINAERLDQKLLRLSKQLAALRASGFVFRSFTQRRRKYPVGMLCPICHKRQVQSRGKCKRCYSRERATRVHQKNHLTTE